MFLTNFKKNNVLRLTDIYSTTSCLYTLNEQLFVKQNYDHSTYLW